MTKTIKAELQRMQDSYSYTQLQPDDIAAWLVCSSTERIQAVSRAIMAFEQNGGAELTRVFEHLDRGSRKAAK